MPCYHFTYHGHGTWMPDRAAGYVHRTRGLMSADPAMAQRYRRNQREPSVDFSEVQLHLLIDTIRLTTSHLDIRVHAIGADKTHIHVVVSWKGDRSFTGIRSSIRYAMTRALNQRFARRTWFSDQPSRKRVRNREHFNQLVTDYLPRHPIHWVEPSIAGRLRRPGADA
jgi:REP element-mobilizing transposase RayT